MATAFVDMSSGFCVINPKDIRKHCEKVITSKGFDSSYVGLAYSRGDGTDYRFPSFKLPTFSAQIADWKAKGHYCDDTIHSVKIGGREFWLVVVKNKDDKKNTICQFTMALANELVWGRGFLITTKGLATVCVRELAENKPKSE